jgi:hypothetical protein
MKLGSETGSVMNHLYSRATIGEPTPFPGMGATILWWTDRSPATIVEVNLVKKYIVVQIDKVVRVDGGQDCEFVQNPKAPRLFYKKNRKGVWVRHEFNERGRLVQARGQGLRIGERDWYHDPSF